MEINRKIAEWIGRCWHDNGCWVPQIVEKGEARMVCRKSGDDGKQPKNQLWPDYTASPTAMVELIEAVRVKGYHFDCHSGESKMKYLATFGFHLGNADTLPMAVALAVEKLIDAEKGE